MDGKIHIRMAFNHQEPDRVPTFELAFSSELASRILGREVYLPSSDGSAFLHFLQAYRQGPDTLAEAARQSARDAIELYTRLGLDMIRVRVTDFLVPVDFGFGNYGANAIFNVTIKEVDKNRWRIIGPDGWWSEHVYNPKTKAMFEADHTICHEGIDGLRRLVEYLEAKPISIGPYIEAGLEGVREAVEAAAQAGIFVLGWGDVAYPGASPYLPIFLEAMLTDPRLIERYMDITTEGALALVRVQLDVGVDGIVGGNDWCFKTGPMFSPQAFRRFFVPHLRRIRDECHARGAIYIKHLDGNVMLLLEDLIERAGIDGLHPIEPNAGMDIFALKEQYGGRITLLGNIQLTGSTPDEVAAETRNVIRHVAPGGGYVLSSSSGIHDAVPLDNLYAMLDTAKEYGRYPIVEDIETPGVNYQI